MPSVDPDTVPAASDAIDVRLAAGGDARAYERIYRRHVPRIHGLARRMAGDDDAGDLTQMIFVRAWERLGSFRGDAAFGTWLYRLAINVILGRRAATRTERERRDHGEGVIEAIPARPARSEHRIDFDAAIGRLPPGARRVFVLHDIEGYKHEEIARMLRVTAGTSKAQLHRARMLMRAHLER
ncbi:MAG: RNA polymerase sigma factor [Candidatus Eisenbacteria bacterium]|nr:RNA polymerase sigma factor [Candidatus Eisenbacteria bacterium]